MDVVNFIDMSTDHFVFVLSVSEGSFILLPAIGAVERLEYGRVHYIKITLRTF